jgi:hypothetical protein
MAEANDATKALGEGEDAKVEISGEESEIEQKGSPEEVPYEEGEMLGAQRLNAAGTAPARTLTYC